jgi:hypothetical protein
VKESSVRLQSDGCQTPRKKGGDSALNSNCHRSNVEVGAKAEEANLAVRVTASSGDVAADGSGVTIGSV